MNAKKYVLVVFVLNFATKSSTSTWNRKLENSIMKSYDKNHRPVKDYATTTQVVVYMLISHIEGVNEHDQTMKLHGKLFLSWQDEYLIWEPKKWNNFEMMSIETWKIWQPTIALYNNAQGNAWNLRSHGLPASLASDGTVWIVSTYSFHVTCLFDFSEYPNDEQECPIVLADWVYDLSQVNLTDPGQKWTEPTVALSNGQMVAKKHVAGWKVINTSRRHCYWGPNGCVSETPDSPLEWFWSVIEFKVRIRRHMPYFGLTVTLPTLITCFVTLTAFWIDSDSLILTLLLLNILIQGVFGWDLIRDLPPGSGSVPKIVPLYGFNLFLTSFAFIMHIVLQYLKEVLPEDKELSFRLTNITERLNSMTFFQLRGLQFDPQRLLDEDEGEYREQVRASENAPKSHGKLVNQLYICRRALFFLYVFIYAIVLLLLLA